MTGQEAVRAAAIPPVSTSAVPPGTCLMHGPFVGSVCPTCSTATLTPGLNQVAPIELRVKCPSCPFVDGCPGQCGWKVENNG